MQPSVIRPVVATECDACHTTAGPFFPRIVFARKPGQRWGGKPYTDGFTCMSCKRAHRPATETTMRVAKMYTVPAAPAQLPARSYVLTAHHDYDVFVYGVYLTTQEAYLWCEQAADDALWHIREAVRAAEYDQERIDAEYARMVAAFSHPATAQAIALRLRDEDDLEFEVAA
jgi:hypothetical protein